MKGLNETQTRDSTLFLAKEGTTNPLSFFLFFSFPLSSLSLVNSSVSFHLSPLLPFLLIVPASFSFFLLL